ncbi:ABC transporter permease [Actinomadura sp. DC4]|uniref:ABC transporter permease n=1 Tax=Actinomadura sp. DC4 TaxID=3055069 RepID=UPI0025B0C411|nr:ABC transporter permease [Actinomadura sp. DC4]MDN3356938.1 ABC transporter permease [Actinomadura sp. DC4]
MIWLTWRQFRTQAMVIFGGVAVLAVILAATGPRLVHLHRTRGDAFINDLTGTDSALYVFAWLAVLALPALIGMFWGAPLVTRELDAGTHRLAWTQTTRTRWLCAKLGFIGLAAMAVAGSLSLAVSWWAAPIDAAVASRNGEPGPGVFVFSRLSREIFDARGIVPVGYAAFAFVLGVTLGILIRRTLPAMAVLLAVFMVAQVVMSVWVRPLLMAPEHQTVAITAKNLTLIDMHDNLHVIIDRPGAWVTSQHTVNAAGQAARPPSWAMSCPETGGLACFARLDKYGYRQLVYYQPAGRFWALQWYETTIYLALALALTGLSTWWIHRRLS